MTPASDFQAVNGEICSLTEPEQACGTDGDDANDAAGPQINLAGSQTATESNWEAVEEQTVSAERAAPAVAVSACSICRTPQLQREPAGSTELQSWFSGPSIAATEHWFNQKCLQCCFTVF